MSLFSSVPTISYVESLLMTITIMAAIFTHCAAVFPLSKAIDFFSGHMGD
jgi:hypothetical protein